MRKIDLDELYGGYFEWCDELSDGKGGELEIKPLREHLQEWVKMTDYRCIRENKQRIQDILDGKDLYVSDDAIGFGYSSDYDEVSFEEFDSIKKKIADEAREQGIKPPKTWYRDKVDNAAYDAVNPDLPF